MRTKYTWKTGIKEALIFLCALAYLIPLYLVITVSLKPANEIYSNPMNFPAELQWSNFSYVWGESIGKSYLSSIVILVVSVALLVIIGSMTSYCISRHTGKMSRFVYLLFLTGIMIPFQLSIITIYVWFSKIGLVGNIIGMICLWTGVYMPMTVILYSGFCRSLPKDYEEAARVDGAGKLRIFFTVVFPLLRPVTGTVAIIMGLFVWNDFFASSIFLSGSEVMTLPVAIYQFVGQYTTQWNLVFAAVLFAIIPVIIIYIFTQKTVIRGFTGGIKG